LILELATRGGLRIYPPRIDRHLFWTVAIVGRKRFTSVSIGITRGVPGKTKKILKYAFVLCAPLTKLLP